MKVDVYDDVQIWNYPLRDIPKGTKLNYADKLKYTAHLNIDSMGMNGFISVPKLDTGLRFNLFGHMLEFIICEREPCSIHVLKNGKYYVEGVIGHYKLHRIR